MGKNTVRNLFPTTKGDDVILSFFQQKKEDETLNQAEQSVSNVDNGEKIPEFDVNGTALNDIHSSLFES